MYIHWQRGFVWRNINQNKERIVVGRIKDRFSNWVRNWDGVQGTSSVYSISARTGKHYCPYCKGLLQIKRKQQIVNSETEEAKKFDFSAYEGSMIGNIKFIWDVFYCEDCNIEISTGDIYRFEQELIKNGGNIDFDEFQKGKNIYPNKKANMWLFIIIAFLFTAVFMLILILIDK